MPEEERQRICKFVSETFAKTLYRVLEALAEKEGKRGDAKMIEIFANQYSKDSTLLSFKILFELLAKEQRHFQSTDFAFMLKQEVFLKSVFVCAIECVFCINIVKQISIQETLELMGMKPFDYWRILNSFLKFDPLMPRSLNTHFREVEVKIVTEYAWALGSPVVELVKEICSSPDANDQLASSQERVL